ACSSPIGPRMDGTSFARCAGSRSFTSIRPRATAGPPTSTPSCGESAAFPQLRLGDQKVTPSPTRENPPRRPQALTASSTLTSTNRTFPQVVLSVTFWSRVDQKWSTLDQKWTTTTTMSCQNPIPKCLYQVPLTTNQRTREPLRTAAGLGLGWLVTPPGNNHQRPRRGRLVPRARACSPVLKRRTGRGWLRTAFERMLRPSMPR